MPRGVCRARKLQRRRAEVLKKVVIPGVIVAFLVFYIVTSPDQAADIFHTGWHSVVSMAHGVGHFLNKLAT